MEFQGYTPFPSSAWVNVNSVNECFISSLVRVKFKFVEVNDDGVWRILFHEEQEDLFSEDIYYEDENSSVKFESDYVSFKKQSDLIVNAYARNPKPEYFEEFLSSVHILNEKDEIIKKSILKIKGSYEISKSTLGISSSKKEKNIAIRYNKAYGGNVLDNEEKDKIDSIKAYQISFENEEEYLYPAGFGFISRTFKEHVKKAGTYDDKCLKEPNTLPAKDFDEEYNQSSNPSLRLKGYLKAGYCIRLENLMNPDFLDNTLKNLQYIKIPKLNFITKVRTTRGDIHKQMNLDTFIIDINNDDISKCCIYASYRIRIKKPKELLKVEIMLEEINNG